MNQVALGKYAYYTLT